MSMSGPLAPLDDQRAGGTIRAIVTGASRGIGRAIALELAGRGAHLALVARSADRLDQVRREVSARGGRGYSYPRDLTETSEHPGLLRAIATDLGGITGLINNAGIFDFAPVAEADLARWDSVLDLNLRSIIHLTHHAIPYLSRESSSAIVNISSIAGKDYVRTGGIYAAAKFGLFGFAGCLFEDVRDLGIKVCTIGPAQVSARMDQVSPGEAGLIPAADIARLVAFVLEFSGGSCPTEILVRPQRSLRRAEQT